MYSQFAKLVVLICKAVFTKEKTPHEVTYFLW